MVSSDGLLTGLRPRLRVDHLVRGSLYLIASSGLQAGLGFAFWVIAARLVSPADLGVAGSLISATAVIGYLSLLGLNTALVRHLPTAADRDALLTPSFALVAATGALLGVLYALLVGGLAPRLAFVGHQPAMVAGFAVLSAAAAVNLLTDSVFVAARKASWSALTDGVVGGVAKLVSVVALGGAGAYGLFCASAGGFAAAGLASLVLMVTALGWRPLARQSLRALRPLLRFSAASYTASLCGLLPNLAVPLIVLDRLGARPAAYYFIAFQVATVLYGTTYAVEQSFLAEGSHPGVSRAELLSRSWRVLAGLCLPACLVLIVAGHWVLLLFGRGYSQRAGGALVVLALAVIPVAANHWLWTVLRLAGRLQGLVVSSLVYAGAVCGLAWVLAPRGLTALAVAWPAGGLAGAAVAAAVAVPRRSRLGQGAA